MSGPQGGPPAAWAELDSPWRTCIALAWEAYGRGTTPVGAVVVDGAGREVARGANARCAAADGLAGSHLAHAEIVALCALSAQGRYPDHVVYTSLEPCLLCVGAATMATVGRIRWAGVDPSGGATTAVVAGANAHLRRRPATFEGPLEGLAGLFCAALHVESYLRRSPDGHVVAAYRDRRPTRSRRPAPLAS